MMGSCPALINQFLLRLAECAFRLVWLYILPTDISVAVCCRRPRKIGSLSNLGDDGSLPWGVPESFVSRANRHIGEFLNLLVYCKRQC